MEAWALSGSMVVVSDPAEFDRYRAAEEPEGDYHRFKLNLGYVVLTSLHPDGDRMVIERWSPTDGYTSVDRS